MTSFFEKVLCNVTITSLLFVQVNSDARILIKSNCPCNFTMFYEILSRGNIVQSGSKRILPSNSENLLSERNRLVNRERAPSREMLAGDANENS